ncbi:MAG: hypothetical protein IT294_07465 [Deltaproteobacteria bacterium]|nr:hypothetical protein [Deltaproteobacteria bacterium]
MAGPRELCDDGTPDDTGDSTDRCFGCTELCGPRPRTDCHVAGGEEGKASLVLRPGGARGPTLDFRWQSALATAEELADPLTRASYALCVYDGGSAGQPLFEAQARVGQSCTTGACWKRFGRHGFRYSDRSTKNGLTQVQLARKSSDRMRIRVVGKGATTAPASMPLMKPVTVQLVNSATAGCWQASFPAPTTNEPTAFRAAVR